MGIIKMRNLKSYKVFEAYPPSNFEINSESLYREIIQDAKEILLELSDSGISYDVNKYIDDVIFEFQIEIKSLKTAEQKQICEDSLFRLEKFLEKYNINLEKIEMEQLEKTRKDIGLVKVKKHDFDLYSMSELENLKDSTGVISLNIYFSKNNYR